MKNTRKKQREKPENQSAGSSADSLYDREHRRIATMWCKKILFCKNFCLCRQRPPLSTATFLARRRPRPANDATTLSAPWPNPKPLGVPVTIPLKLVVCENAVIASPEISISAV
ncbi:MAG: hypothetical protein LBU39_10925 [Desulfobulbaceae bacterium]|jgi:hypothetical protein|nr:hypothetical protein [Desulfobulbaceae bacterium]